MNKINLTILLFTVLEACHNNVGSVTVCPFTVTLFSVRLAQGILRRHNDIQ
jgi:hypothetical protein